MSRWGNCISWLVLTLSLRCCGSFNQDTMVYKHIELKLDRLLHLASLSDVDHLRYTVQALAVQRVVDTPGHTKVRDYIRGFLENLNWQVKFDVFTEEVPILGYLTFMNIVARQNPNAKRYLMLGCHYDSKYYREFEFVGATDSAVPCAILLNLAEALKDQLKRSDLSLMFVFFDGEEAFKNWTKEDSLYGSRHLAQQWLGRHLLSRIDLFLLLDLIGAPDTSFKMLINATSSYYQRLVELEKRIVRTGILQRKKRIFHIEHGQDVADDHFPFLEHQVPVVHLIAEKYPKVWHRPEDVEQRIDYKIVEQVDLVLRMFIVEYFTSKSSSKSVLLRRTYI
ncbi:hypothetical protein KR038_006668 [Drosophila bunnanda]|nr:hypothetical protein KR038_006668 [Drosophila bunnanda]